MFSKGDLKITAEVSDKIFQEKDQNIVVIAGRWICYINGVWDFKLDNSRLGRCLNVAKISTFEDLKNLVLEEFMLNRDVHVELSYWEDGDESSKPFIIGSDRELEVLKTRQKEQNNVTIFSSFRELVDGEFVFLSAASKVSVVSNVVPNEAMTSEQANNDDEELIALLDAHEKMYQGAIVLGNNMPTCDNATDECADNNSDQENVNDEGWDSDEASEEDYDYDFWTDLINRENGENVGCELSDNDDFVDPSAVRRSKISLALEKCNRDVNVEEIYGFDDVEPIFNTLGMSAYGVSEIDLNKEDDEIYKGRIFRNKEEFKISMSIYAIKRVFRFRISRHAKLYTVMQCIDKTCDWRVYAHQLVNSDHYEVRKVYLTHTCTTDSRGQFNKHATTKVVAALLRAKFGNITTGPRAKDLPEMVLAEHNIDASYWKCWKARELAIAEAQGTEEKSYEILPVYLHVLKHSNPGTVTHLRTHLEKNGVVRFKYVFISLGASIAGMVHLRRVVVVDGTHLHGKYKGTLLTASFQDANFQIFPIAFAVVDSENDESWKWFFEKLSEIVMDDKNLVFISDRHASIYNGLKAVYVKAGHGACLIHLVRNVTARFKTKFIPEMVTKAGEVYRVSEFKSAYDDIKKKDLACWKYLEEIDLQHWTRAYFPGMRYNLMSSNIAESLNKALLPARDSPIVALLEFIRRMLCRWFCSRRKKASTVNGDLPPEVDKLLREHLENSVGMSVLQASNWDFEVRGKVKGKYHVNLEHRTCTCLVFDKLRIPCSHAVAAIRKVGMKESVFVDEVHKKNRWNITYEGIILPLQDPDDIEIPASVKKITFRPPKTRRPSGRPPKKRKPCIAEFPVRKKTYMHKCSRCGGTGHNRVTCKNPLN